MAANSRQNFFSRLHPLAYEALEDALVGLSERQVGRSVDLADWLKVILRGGIKFEFNAVLDHFNVDRSRLESDVDLAVSKLAKSSEGELSVSPFIDRILNAALIYQAQFNAPAITTGHILLALVSNDEISGRFYRISRTFSQISPEQLEADFAVIVESSVEAKGHSEPVAADSSGKETTGPNSNQSALERFTVDLTEKARKGEIDPIVGRDEEVRQIIDILMRRRQNNPVLVGEAGVGKTAAVEGFAHRIVSGDVPSKFKDVVLRSLDVGLLHAGASVKGEFEQRLRSVIDEVQKSVKPIILFIDEVHTLIGAGGQAGTGDAANLLKPALARGQLRTIAATTWDEYRKHVEKDPALSRRFQQIFVAEPDEAKAIRMLRFSMGHLEKHHFVQILDEAIEAAVRLSVRFIPARQLPDKAVSLLDTASARVAISQDITPAPIEDLRRRIDALGVESGLLRKEALTGQDHSERINAIEASMASDKAALADLEKRFADEKGLITRIIALRTALRAAGTVVDPAPGATAPLPSGQSSAKLGELKQLQEKLTALQGESPMLFPCVDAACVAAVVSEWTGIPVGRMARRNIAEVLNLGDTLEQRVIGQRHALDLVARRIQSSRARLENPDRPVAVFMFVGPSGTGKTETALSLAETLYGGEQNLININMAEFSEKHTVSTLKGSPPGYVGYGDGGILTEAVRRRPYSVVLLDEVEKAHPDVHKMFFQVFDKGAMDDSEGRAINFRNCVIILTSNAAQETIIKMCEDPDLKPGPEALESALRVPLTKVFPDALLNRLVVVPYYPITAEILHRIIRLNFARLEKRVRENHRVPFTYEDSVVELVAKRCGELERGARMVEAMITNTLIPRIGHEILTRALENRSPGRVHVSVADGEFAFAFD